MTDVAIERVGKRSLEKRPAATALQPCVAFSARSRSGEHTTQSGCFDLQRFYLTRCRRHARIDQAAMPCAFQLDDPRRPWPGCQFAVPEEELTVVDTSNNKSLCQFHLPMPQKIEWDGARIDAFNVQVFACIDRAKETGGIADLSGVVFPGSITFERYVGDENHLPELMFLGTTFDDASFDGVRFGRHVDFQWATFSGHGSFDRATFGGDAWFRSTNFSHDVSFEQARFGHKTCFDEATFGGHADFSRAIFSGHADLRNVRFSGEANFRDTSFERDALFTGTRFERHAWFNASIFRGDAWLNEMVFCQRASFKEVTFTHNAGFQGTVFRRYARFEKATFGGNAWFLDDRAREEPDKGTATFSGFVTFEGATFASHANFTNRRFLRGADFRGATFAVAPEFHNAALHQDTRFSGTKFLDRKGTHEVDAASAYRTLKLAMESVRARDEEAMFYAYEQESLRYKKETPWSVKLFSLLYEQTADYGRSFMRPLIWLIFAFLLFWFSYALIGGPVFWRDGGSVLRFALQQVFQPFWVFRSGVAMPGTGAAVPVWLAAMAALHSVLSLSFLTLFVLALRRRFRLD